LSLANERNIEETAVALGPRTTGMPRRRVTFSEEIEARQALMMISAPIALTSPCNSDDSDDRMTDDDRSTSESSDEEKSEGSADEGDDDDSGSQQGADSNAEIGAEDEKALQEVDEGIIDYSSPPTELSMCGDEEIALQYISGHEHQFKPYPCQIRATSESIEELQERKLSQVSIELGIPNWSPPHDRVEKQPHSQVQDPDGSLGKPYHYLVVEAQS
jgi:hypothetical protein